MRECDRFDTYAPQIPIVTPIAGENIVISREPQAFPAGKEVPVKECLVGLLETGDPAGVDLWCMGCGMCGVCQSMVTVETEAEILTGFLRER